MSNLNVLRDQYTSLVDKALDSAKDLSTKGLGIATGAALKHFEASSKSAILVARLVKGLIDCGLDEQGQRIKAICKGAFAIDLRKGTDGAMRFKYKSADYLKIDDEIREKVFFFLDSDDGLDGAFKWLTKHLDNKAKSESKPDNATTSDKLNGIKNAILKKSKEIGETINQSDKAQVTAALVAIRALKSELSSMETALEKSLKNLAAQLSAPVEEIEEEEKEAV